MLHALVAESCNAPGTSTFSLAGPLTGCVPYSTRFLDGDPVFYLATDGSGHYEGGMGTIHSGTPWTLSRDTVTENHLSTTTKIAFSGTIQVINFIASDKAVYLDNTGTAHIHGAAVVHGTLEVDGDTTFGVNGIALYGKDSGGVARLIFQPLDSSNNTRLFVGGSASTPVGKLQVLDRLGANVLFSIDNSGQATVKAGLTVTGGGVSIPNNVGFTAKDTGGTVQNMIFIDSANNLDVQIPNHANAFRVLNHAGSASLFDIDDLGDARLRVGTLAITTGNLFVQGISTFTGNVGCSGAIETFGAIGTTTAGWEYGPSGGSSLGSSARNFGIIVGSSVNVLANAYDAYSDVRLKTDIKAITAEQGMAFVLDSNPCTFVKAGSLESGFIAQDMIRAGYEHMITHYDYPGLPELDEGGLVSRPDVALSMVYDQTIAYIAAAMKGAFARIQVLERRL